MELLLGEMALIIPGEKYAELRKIKSAFVFYQMSYTFYEQH